MSKWGIVQTGFKRKRYKDIFTDLVSRARTNFGKNVVTDTNKPLGKIFDIISWAIAQLWEALEDVYNAISVLTAEGMELDRLVKYKNLSRKLIQTATGFIQITGAEGTVVSSNFIIGKDSGISYFTSDTSVIPTEGMLILPITCNASGTRGNAEIGEITNIITPITGVDSVTNVSAITNGQDYETDSELRARYIETVGGINTLDSIKIAVSKVDGVKSVFVNENVSEMTDADGIRSKSIAVYVYAAEGTEIDYNIADAILKSKAGGIRADGNMPPIIVNDINGFEHEISFTRVNIADIYIKIDLAKNSLYPTDGQRQIKDKIIEYIGGELSDETQVEGIQVGMPVIASKANSLVWDIDGISDARTQISLDNVNFVDTKISIGNLQKAITDASKITINEVV